MRERRMLEFMNQITDRPSWLVEVFDRSIMGKWVEETVRWDESLPEKGDYWLSKNMFRNCMEELREKAKMITIHKVGFVSVLDCEVNVVKSDWAVSDDLRERLIKAVKPFEDVPESAKDWCPGSDNKVLNLVDPSLFPISYGYSRALPHGTVPLETCTSYIGKGDEIPKNESDPQRVEAFRTGTAYPWGFFQWLPSNIRFLKDGTPKIDSYINNLHPQHAELYQVLEKLIQIAIPLWNESISWIRSRNRIHIRGFSSLDYYYPDSIEFPREQYQPDPVKKSKSLDEWHYDFRFMDPDRDWAAENGLVSEWEAWHDEHKILLQHEPTFTPRSEFENRPEARPIDLQKDFHESGIQVIIKLVNIELTPEKPTYDGESWHFEGSLNEHICSTALYYYDSENVTDSHVSFRQRRDGEMFGISRDMFESAQAYLGTGQDPIVFDLGSVLIRPGRFLVFPNVLQNKVQPFSLVDRTRPGHRKLLAMFLVDPHVPILSTAKVAPQRKDWWVDEVRNINPFSELPMEVFDMIMDVVEGFPFNREEALKMRIRLMEQRARVDRDVNKIWTKTIRI